MVTLRVEVVLKRVATTGAWHRQTQSQEIHSRA